MSPAQTNLTRRTGAVPALTLLAALVAEGERFHWEAKAAGSKKKSKSSK